MPAPSYRMFVSYSRKDENLVGPLVQLLRIVDEGIFQDVDGIPPGIRWRAMLTSVIDNCQVLLLFWCHHSSTSKEVANEYRRALQNDKRIVPVLLDFTAMPPELAEFQAIDLRQALGSHDEGWTGVEEESFGALPGDRTEPLRTWGVIAPNQDLLSRAGRKLEDDLLAIFAAGTE